MVYEPLAPMVDGPHTATMTSKDVAGNAVSMTWNWWVDASAPSIVINSPADNMITDQATVTVSGQTESGATLTVASLPVAVAIDGTFSTTTSLIEGSNVIDIVATDLLGNTARTSRTVVYDATTPTLLSVRSTEGSRTRASSTMIKGSSSEPLAWVTVNGAPAQVFADGSFQIASDLSEGSNAFSVQAADFAGHTRTASLTVVRDTTAPIITPDAIASTYITEVDKNTVKISGNVSGGATAVRVNGFPVSAQDGAFSRTFTLSLGSNVFVIEADDDLGNTASQTVSVTYAPLVVERSYRSVIALAVGVVLLIVGLAVGWVVRGRRGPAATMETPAAPAEAPAPPPPPAMETPGKSPEEMPAEEEMTTEEEEL